MRYILKIIIKEGILHIQKETTPIIEYLFTISKVIG